MRVKDMLETMNEDELESKLLEDYQLVGRLLDLEQLRVKERETRRQQEQTLAERDKDASERGNKGD